jgi:hypothetical protein
MYPSARSQREKGYEKGTIGELEKSPEPDLSMCDLSSLCTRLCISFRSWDTLCRHSRCRQVAGSSLALIRICYTGYYVDDNGRRINIHAGDAHKCYRRRVLHGIFDIWTTCVSALALTM